MARPAPGAAVAQCGRWFEAPGFAQPATTKGASRPPLSCGADGAFHCVLVAGALRDPRRDPVVFAACCDPRRWRDALADPRLRR